MADLKKSGPDEPVRPEWHTQNNFQRTVIIVIHIDGRTVWIQALYFRSYVYTLDRISSRLNLVSQSFTGPSISLVET